jgi:hypothetical protein
MNLDVFAIHIKVCLKLNGVQIVVASDILDFGIVFSKRKIEKTLEYGGI